MRRLISAAAGFALLLSAAVPAAAQAVEYAYTPIDLKQCKHSPGRIEGFGSWLCPGYGGMAILISSAEQRSFVSFGANAKKQQANRESLIAQNGEGKNVEWRIETLPDGRKRAYAAIMRWYTVVTPQDDASKSAVARGQVLVVTRLDPGGVCHIGYVDARANADANELARKIADERARSFRCGSDIPDSMGATGPGFSPRQLME